jgi:signal transduction histidine kinase
MNYDDIELSSFVREITDLLQVHIRLKTNVYLLQHVASDVPRLVQSDYQRLKQILINLLRNSTKFTQEGYIMLKVYRSRLGMRKGDELIGYQESVTFEVFDTGIGVSDANKSTVFQLFGKVMQKDR